MTTATIKLADVADIERSGLQPSDIPDGAKYLGLEHIESGGHILKFETVAAGELASSKFQFDESHILYGKLRPYLAKIALPDFKGVCSTDILPIRPGPQIDRGYLAHFLRQPTMVDFASMRATGINLPRLSPKALADFEIPLPPLDEQRRIAAILDQADALRRLRVRALDGLNTLGEAIFHEMFGSPLTNPMRWKTESFGDCVENRDSLRIPVKQSDRDNRPGPYPYYGSVGVIDDIDDFLFEGEHLLVSEDGKHLESRSRPIACLADGRFWVNNHAHVVRDNGRADLVFLKSFLDATSIRHHISGIDQIKLNRRSMDKIPVPLPPRDLQDDYRAHIVKLNKLKLAAETALQTAIDLFTSLQYRAFRGEL